jgi:hypothetical protein
MTKAEKAELERLRQELTESMSLGFSGLPEPKPLPIPEKGYINGWIVNPFGESRVEKAWTESTRHGDGHRTDDTRYISGFNVGRELFATELDALTALRLMKERECAKILARIDRQINEARAKAATEA